MAPAPKRGQAQSLGGEQVEGRQAVRELLRARRRRVRDIWLAEGAEGAPVLEEIVSLAGEQNVPVRRVGRSRLDAEAGTDAPQGVLAHAEPLHESTLEDLAAAGGVPSSRGGPLGGRRPSGLPFLLVMDGITDPHNLGSVLRSGEVAGATGAVVPRHRSAHVTPTVAKVAAGAVEYVAMASVAGIPSALARLKDLGVWTVGLDADARTSVFDLAVATEPVALVLGAEGSGLGRLTRERCDLLVSIPRGGAIESLNVAAAAAVACFEVARRRSDPG